MNTGNKHILDHGTVKVVDFGPFLDGSDREGVADAVLESFKTIGFVYLANHGLPHDKISSMFEWSKKLFDLPLEIKQLAPHPESGAHHRGYSAPGREAVKKRTHADREGSGPASGNGAAETASDNVRRDIKENFECGREDFEDMPNIWYPDGILPGFKEACLEFYWILDKMEREILKALALSFKLPDGYFLNFHANSENQLRLLHYPSVLADVLEDKEASRIPAHSDYGTITLLLQDDIGGLEVEDAHNPGTYASVPPIPDTLLVNAGDFLMRWSNDTIKSTVHRVRAPPSVDSKSGKVIPSRYSIPYFCGADSSTVVDCIPSTWSEDRPKLYPPTSAGEYIKARLAANYA
ncbi:thymine dioxygenase [Pholiota conissans]|uniref:Thymine dioxygenase n=1 Tax=Pholiota conissans TaxID=109636 RepID=A0A9P6CWL9_9AGAR|nr:thymine dioxygenase [Pholiota conissans]